MAVVVEALEGRRLLSGGAVARGIAPARPHAPTAAPAQLASVAPASAGEVTIAGDVAFGPAATLTIELGGTAPGTQYDVVHVTGQATLGGTLQVVLLNGFVPQAGDSFRVLTFGSRIGDFAHYAGLQLPNGRGLVPTLTSDALTLTVAPLPTLSINDVSLTEGNPGQTLATFTVTLSAASGANVSVDYATAPGGSTSPATAGADFAAATGTATIPAGQTSATFTVPVPGDVTDEADETFLVNLSNPVNATVADGQGVGTIVDDDAAPTVGFLVQAHQNVTVVEGNGGPGATPAVFTVDLSAPSGKPVTVSYSTANLTAHDGTLSPVAFGPGDYQRTTGTLTIPAGQTSATITVPVNGDDLFEPNEVFNLVLSNPVNAQIGSGAQQAGGIINNDDAPPAASISDASAAENGGNVNFPVTLDHASSASTWIIYTTADGTASARGDYTAAPALSMVFFAPFTTTATIAVPLINDTTPESPETFSVTLTGPGNRSQAGVDPAHAQATGTIADDDVAPPPRVTQVFVSGSAWTSAFREAVQAQRLGESAFGYAVPAGAGQLAVLPWEGIDRVSVRFDQRVVVNDDDLVIWSAAAGGRFPLGGISYDDSTNTATWPLAAPLRADKLLLDLDAGPAGVTAAASGLHLDGDWTGASDTFPSGDGSAGGNFPFRMNALAGDADRSGAVLFGDFIDVRGRLTPSAAPQGTGAAYSLFADVSADGAITPLDEALVRRRYVSALPSAEPVAPSATPATPPAAAPSITRNLFSRRGILQ